jgi:transcription termination factor Rho
VTLPDIVSRAQNDGLASLKLTELKQIAASQGLRGTSGLRKGELIDAISSAGFGGGRTAGAKKTTAPEKAPEQAAPTTTEKADRGDTVSENRTESTDRNEHSDRNDRNDRNDQQDGEGGGRRSRRNRRNRRNRGRGDDRQNNQGNQGQQNNQGDADQQDGRGGRQDNRQGNQQGGGRSERNSRRERNRNRSNQDGGNQGGNQNNQGEPPTPVAGILDFVDANTAFIRTTGYHAGSTDIYVPIQMVRRFGMRHGDAITGTIRPGKQQTANNGQGRNRNRGKYTQLHSVDTVNGLSPEDAAKRPSFHKLTPLYPNQRLRLETTPKILTTRVIDLIMPIGKGQRALIVSPPKAGKTTILQDIANAIAVNNPECHLMVVLVDERPEEVTDMQRSVKGEVIASTFDRPPNEHTAVAELAIERAKRLVEQGQDVVVLLDSITRLGRAYNNSSPASGRILSGGVDSNALYPPKRFLGAARNIENGGSLTIIATAMVETGSAGDTVIFEEFKGTGNAELKLDRKIAERRLFPAVDVNPSGTRKDDLLLGPEEARLMHKLRRILSALDPQAAIDLMIKQLRKTRTNGEFMMQIASSAPLAGDDDE